MTEWYKRCKGERRCVECRGQDERTLAGMVRCAACAKKRSEYWANYYQIHQREVQAREYKHRHKLGMCTKCGIRPAAEGMRTCEKCLEESRMRGEASRRKAGVKPRQKGVICWQCNRAPVEPGKTVCRACHDRIAGYFRRGRRQGATPQSAALTAPLSQGEPWR